jgi:hypothetical protein
VEGPDDTEPDVLDEVFHLVGSSNPSGDPHEPRVPSVDQRLESGDVPHLAGKHEGLLECLLPAFCWRFPHFSSRVARQSEEVHTRGTSKETESDAVLKGVNRALDRE